MTAGDDRWFVDGLARAMVIPVLEIDDAASSLPMATTLGGAGLGFIEVTLRTPVALRSIQLLADLPSVVVGAGTVIRAEQAAQALAAGARFVVSPGFSPGVADVCRDHGVPYLPGIATATELIAASDRGFEVVKFFPAAALGGPAALRALAAAFPEARFVPTGGVDAVVAREYLAMPQVVAVGGSWMAPRSMLHDRQWPEIAELAATAATLRSGP